MGEGVVRLLGLPVPGPVVGLAVMLAVLSLRRRLPAALNETATGLLQHPSRISAEWLTLPCCGDVTICSSLEKAPARLCQGFRETAS